MLLVGGMLAWRQLRHHRGDGARHVARPTLDDPIITFSPTFACQCPRALKVLLTATVVGALTGFLGVGGGFLVVPALLLALALPMEYAAGRSEEHTSELQSLMRISYAVFCLKKKNSKNT